MGEDSGTVTLLALPFLLVGGEDRPFGEETGPGDCCLFAGGLSALATGVERFPRWLRLFLS